MVSNLSKIIGNNYCDICGKRKDECDSLSVKPGICFVYNSAHKIPDNDASQWIEKIIHGWDINGTIKTMEKSEIPWEFNPKIMAFLVRHYLRTIDITK